MIWLKRFILIILLFNTLSCSTPASNALPAKTQQLVSQAERKGFSFHQYHTPYFLLTAYEHFHSNAASPIHVYIEGDGNSWKTKYKLSDNPTPRYPLALALALQDPHPQVIYLARPCQYTAITLDPRCEAKYWSSHRFSAEVIAAFNEVLNTLKAKQSQAQFVLIGFSGGASIATLIAAQRQDVVGVITVAGDLDHVALGHYHHTTPLTGSLYPMAIASQLKNIPQHHWSGSQDPIVPSWVSQQFAQEVDNPRCVKTLILPKATHHRGWVKAWPEILKQPLECK